MSSRLMLCAAVSIVVILANGTSFAGDEPAEPAADARLDPILREWRQRSAANTGLDVRFTLRTRDSAWGGDNSYTGRVSFF